MTSSPAFHRRTFVPQAQTIPDPSEPAMWNGSLWAESGDNRNPRAANKPCEHAVGVDVGGHDIDQHFVLADRPRRQDLELHRRLRRTMAFLADRPSVHLWRDITERRFFASRGRHPGLVSDWSSDVCSSD